ncbi:hypothetical protein [Bacillus sp. FSL K6-3431]
MTAVSQFEQKQASDKAVEHM